MADTTATKTKGGLRIAVDIGGTFTDLAAFDETEGKLMFGKALSTHGELVEGIQNTMDGAGVEIGRRVSVPAWLDDRHQHAARAQRARKRRCSSPKASATSTRSAASIAQMPTICFSPSTSRW